MNVEYINLNNNLYAVTNENGQINVIKSNIDPEKLLNLQNELESKINEKDYLSIKEENDLRFLFIRGLLQTLLNVILTINAIICISNIPIALSLISIGVLTKIISNCLFGSNKKINEQINLLDAQIIELKEEIKSLEEEIKELERKNEYRNICNYERYLKENEEKVLEKPYVRKLSLKR